MRVCVFSLQYSHHWPSSVLSSVLLSSFCDTSLVTLISISLIRDIARRINVVRIFNYKSTNLQC
ncbi:hypothetical protein Sjap_005623 [Stephania japonica]|uniref:Uncharacterized protein n=1 Tax=Stephania japonica TaxID=461633 RepID=A0AAP0PLB8_9MAGN